MHIRELLAFLAIYVIWGSTYLAIRHAVKTIPPLMTAGVRHLLAGLVLYAWVHRSAVRVSGTEWRASLVVAVLFFLIGHGTLHWAEQAVPSGIAALLVATEPLWIAMLMPPAQNSRVGVRLIVGLAAGLAGVGLLMPADAWLRSRAYLWGSVAILLGAMSLDRPSGRRVSRQHPARLQAYRYPEHGSGRDSRARGHEIERPQDPQRF
jgi:drug/metabolite transporter (DMT)-like permease